MTAAPTAMDLPERVAVYRLYRADGTLLYVGVTNNLRVRFKWHAKKSAWWPDVDETRARYEWFDTRQEAAGEERTAIRREAPLRNIAGRGSKVRVGKGRRVRRGNTKRQTMRIPEDLWNKLGQAANALGTDRSGYVREFARWAVHEEGAPEPRRPPTPP